MSSEFEKPCSSGIEQLLSSERDVRDHFLARADQFNLILEKGQEAYPDLHMRGVESGEIVYIELEHLASNFLNHGHHEQNVENDADWLVCATDDLEDAEKDKLPVNEIVALDEKFGAEVLYTPHYRIAEYQSASDRRKSMGVRVKHGNLEARMEDETKDEEESAAEWTDDSKGTVWVPAEEFVELFRKMSSKQIDDDVLGEQIFGGEEVQYKPLLDYGHQIGQLEEADDREVIASHKYYHPRKEEEYIAKAVLRVNKEQNPANFRIQHFSDGGSQFISQRTTIYNYDEFPGVFNKFSADLRKKAFINGDVSALIQEVERERNVSLAKAE